jgi:hypothetical protein
MPEVHIWRTLTGVVALTPEGFGFSFCANQSEIAKLRSDLESGVPMAQAVGFSGSHCGFGSLVRVEAREKSPTIIVVARDFLGKAKEDFTFRNLADREAFYEKLLEFLGPAWQWQQTSHGSWVLLIAPAFCFLVSVFCVACGGLLIATPRNPVPKPDAQGPPLPDWVPFVMVGVSLMLAALCVLWFFKSRGGRGTIYETICKR